MTPFNNRSTLRNFILFFTIIFAFAVLAPNSANAFQKADEGAPSDLQFTSLPTAADSIAIRKKADSVAKAKTDSVARVQATAKAAAEEAPKSLWQLFVIGFLGGFAAFLLPCVYPMLPLTVSFFTKKGGTRANAIWQSILYGLSIIFIYVFFGLLITLVFGPAALNALATNGVFNFFFFLMLVVFGVSFLGAFEITLPSSLANKLDQNSDKGGLAGIFFMASTLVVVSFSCTGPAIGGVLASAFTKGERLAPIIVMSGFSLAIALPFTIFAMFPSLLKSLPKSGGWLNSVKVVLGFIEIAFALKFLSNVDLAYHWNLIDREVVLSIWIAIGVLLSLYLTGKIKFAHDSDIKHLTVTRTFFAMAAFAFTVYMVPGLWGAPLKSISALLPPLSTQDFDLSAGGSPAAAAPANTTTIKVKKYEELFKRLPKVKGLEEWYDYDQAIEVAKQLHKPILIDFTGWNCVNCRKMEQEVFPDPAILKSLQNDFVMLQMVIDEKTDLPAAEQYKSAVTGKNITTIGGKMLDFEISRYNSNAQPFYVIVNEKGKSLVTPQGASNIETFKAYLASGLAAYKAAK
ncbi:protein-disulfide reductase DsbD family protein [Mucilaginibacter psychrotolerans]|uniref:Thioredoxin family protein n=1 Tax=Mucilaginibacter psychrotolerans TaxID=1524096 RepID=A0A4Y8SCX1_9SPHI|nr:thioredoxin family protein [Mucilaginibacter psychrotolerans]TFF36521.1 thioredoxin family protein [Mucilaginibacter psychrotolerans]